MEDFDEIIEEPVRFEMNQNPTIHRRLRVKDHFNLQDRCDSLTIGSKTSHIFQTKMHQVVLEEDEDEDLLVVRMAKNGSIGLSLLRSFYAITALLMSGFLFIFSVQVLLSLVLGMAIDIGITTSPDIQVGQFLFSLFAMRYFVYGLSSFMTIAIAFISDVWGGSHFFTSIGGSHSMLLEWANCIIFLIVPLTTATITLYLQLDRWWELTALIWICCVFCLFEIFMFFAVSYEIRGCVELVRFEEQFKQELDGKRLFSYHVFNRAMICTQRQRFSPTRVDGLISDKSGNAAKSSYIRKYADTKMSIWSKIGNSSFFRYYGIMKELSEPKVLRDIDEIRNVTPIETRRSWDLEKLFCFNKKKQVVTVINGTASLQQYQVKSTIACAVLGQLLTVALIIAVLVWLEASPSVITLGCIVIFFSFFDGLRRSSKSHFTNAFSSLLHYFLISFNGFLSFGQTVGLYKLYQDSQTETTETLNKIRQRYRLAVPTDSVCKFLFYFEQIVFFIFPVTGLFTSSNFELAALFIVVAPVSILRRFVNLRSCLEEVGSMESVAVNNTSKEETWDEQHRLNLILGKINNEHKREIWSWIFTVIVSLLFTIALFALVSGVDEGTSSRKMTLHDFRYNQIKNFPYPTCRLGTNTTRPDSEETALVDFVYLSVLAYNDPNVTQKLLDNWFGKGTAIDQENITAKFKEEYNDLHGETPTAYKLVDFPAHNLSVITIRGTSNGWDALADAQIWLPAILAQSLRSLIPFGEIWNPILRHLITAISTIESPALSEVKYYRETTAFANFVKKERKNLFITGHSLGGGVAMITGGQTQTPALAVSGPNNMLSRNTFSPPLTKDQIDNYMFNIIPDRDPVPMFDDKGPLFQNIQCKAPGNFPLGCHFSTRSLCEVLYTCGSYNRPLPCDCHDSYGYPKPEAIGTRTYEDACPPSS